jgi:PAS domain S-box-containing protein
MVDSGSDARLMEQARAARRHRKGRLENLNSTAGEQGSDCHHDGPDWEGYRTLFDNVPCAAYSAFPGRTGRTAFISKKWQEWTGFSCEQLCQDSNAWPKCIHPDDKEDAVEAYAAACRDAVPYNLEYRLVHKDTGQAHHVKDQGFLSKNEDGSIMRVDGIITDVTDLIEAEKELKRHRDNLEDLAKQRTAELSKACDALKLERNNHKKAEEDVLTERNRLASVIGAIQGSLTIWDLEYTLTYQNDYSTNMFGSRIGEKCYRVFQGGDAVREDCPVKLAFRDGKSHTSVRKVVLDTGEATFWRNTANPIRDTSGRITSCLEVSTDITEFKLSQDALRASEDRLRILFESAPDGIYLGDMAGNFVDANKAAEELAGYSKDELVGKNVSELGLLPPEQVARAFARLEKITAGEPVGPEEFRIKRKDGGEVSVEISTFPVTIQGQKLSLGIARDITERKRALEALRQSDRKFRTIFETAANLITSVNNEGILLECNSKMEEVMGYEKEEVIGQSMAKIIHPDYIEKAQSVLKEVVSAGFARNKEYKMIRKDGSEIDVSVNSTALKDENGEFVRTLCIIDDITERKQAEQKVLEDREQLKSLASQLSITEERERHRLATVLHDQIGQSLVFSKFKLDLLRKSASSAELVEALEDVCNSLGQVIDDTRTLTFDLSSPILYELGLEAAIAEWLRDEIQDKHGLETEFEDDRQPKQLDDDIRTVLFRNVRELLVNIVKHAQAHKVKVCIRRVGENVRISVEDDGVGFDPVDVTSRAAKRAEFGLFSIRQRLEQLGGVIEIASEPGRGCTISMTAPLKRDKDGGDSRDGQPTGSS